MKRLLAIALLLPVAAHADDALWALLKQGGQVVLIRHAATDPGVGDPPGFALGDCRTQRNLSAAGRAEAQRLGRAFRARSIPIERVLTSPWCRCLETAQLAFGGAQTERALDNLFGRGENRERQAAAFRKLVAAAPAGSNLVLVTHGSTTLAFTGVSPATAELVILTPARDGTGGGAGTYRVAGRIAIAPDDAPAAAEWTPVGKSNEIYAAFADRASIRRHGGRATMHGLYDFPRQDFTPEGRALYSTVVLREYDCAGRQVRLLSSIDMSGHMGVGEAVLTSSTPRRWEPVLEEGIDDAFLRLACAGE